MALNEFWAFNPDYLFIVAKLDGTTIQLTTMTQCNASNVTGTAVGEMTAVFSDPYGEIADAGIHAMDKVSLRIVNRHGQWGPAWTGIVDAVKRTLDPASGNTVSLTCTSPYKYWEIVTQHPSDVVVLSWAYAQGVTGAAILQYSAKAVGYPQSSLVIDPQAFSGAYTFGQGIDASNFISPDMQTWSAVVQSVLADTGLEMFFDEWGYCHWRRIGYLANPPYPRQITPSDIIHLDQSSGDQGVVTSVEVRWNITPLDQTAGFWLSPASMQARLKRRQVTIYAAWVSSYEGAAFLARTLGQQYAANVNTAAVTIPADPYYQVGSVIEMDLQEGKGSTLYYVTSTSYQLGWGGQWVMTLTLAYGRPPGGSFPYGVDATYPILTAKQIADNQRFTTLGDVLTYDPDQPQTLAGAFKGVVTANVPSGVVYMDKSLNLTGAIIKITDSTGLTFGPTENGYYTVMAPPSGVTVDKDSFLIANLNGTKDNSFNITIVQADQVISEDATSTGNDSGTGTTPPGIGPTSGSGLPADASTITADAKVLGITPTNLSQLALAAAMIHCPGLHYKLATNGSGTPQTWDCDGMVDWAFTLFGYKWPYNVSTGNQFYWLIAHGGVEIDLSKAQIGDLLFFGDMGDEYNQHIGWYIGPNRMFSAMSESAGIGESGIEGFTTFGDPSRGSPPMGLQHVVSMAGIGITTTKGGFDSNYEDAAKLLTTKRPEIPWQVFYIWGRREGSPGLPLGNPLNIRWVDLDILTGGPGNPLGLYEVVVGGFGAAAWPSAENGAIATSNFLGASFYTDILAAGVASQTSHNVLAILQAIDASPFDSGHYAPNGLEADWVSTFNSTYNIPT